jgi:hypothetical protein
MKRQRLIVAVLIGSGILAAALIMALAPVPAHAQSTTQRDAPTTRFYDARGNSVGTATRDSQGTTVFRDSRGNTIGRSSK